MTVTSINLNSAETDLVLKALQAQIIETRDKGDLETVRNLRLVVAKIQTADFEAKFGKFN